MKPDWKDAPEWAQWLAQDEDGQWFWFEKQPAILNCTWWAEDSNWSLAECSTEGWRKSLQGRPS